MLVQPHAQSCHPRAKTSELRLVYENEEIDIQGGSGSPPHRQRPRAYQNMGHPPNSEDIY